MLRHQAADAIGFVLPAVRSLINKWIVQGSTWRWKSLAAAAAAIAGSVEAMTMCRSRATGPLVAALLSQKHSFQLRRREHVLVERIVVEGHVRHAALFIPCVKISLALGNSPVVVVRR